MIKLIATDMDGTLLDETGSLPEGFSNTLTKLKEKDIKLVIASGRPYYTLKHNFGSIASSLSYICENGSLVVDDNKVIFKSVINPEIVKEVIETSKDIEENALILCSENCAYVEHYSDKHLNEIKKYYTNIEIVKNLYDVCDDIIKITICNLENSLHNLNTILKPKFDSKLNVVGSGNVWVDMSNLGVNKGIALKALMDTDNISRNETMVFGDYYNDIEMLAESDYSFVMENAPEDMKKHGNYIAKSNAEHGVLKAIEEYAL